jgi:lipopolysaccharide export system protein LptA
VACLALLAGGLTSWGGRAWAQSQSTGAAAAAGGKTFEMTAEQVTYRGKDRVTVAEGKVLIVYGSFKVSGDWAEYDDRVPCVRVRGKERVRFEDTADKTVLSAGEIVFYLSDEKVEASGGVTLSYQGGRSLASGDILTYLGREKKGVVAGNARVELGGKVFTAASVTVFFSEERIIATGGTRTIIPSEEMTAPDSSSPGKEQ